MTHHEPVNHHDGPTPGSTGELMTPKGDEADLFERYADRLLRATARTVSAPAHVIDEACSFAWMQLVRTQPRRETLFAWLRVVAAREAVRVLRRDQREPSLEALGASDADATDLEAFVEDTGPAVEVLEAEESAAIVPVPEAVIDDSAVDLWGEIQTGLAEAVGVALDAAVFSGTNKPPSWPQAIIPAALAAGNTNVADSTQAQGGVANDVAETFVTSKTTATT